MTDPVTEAAQPDPHAGSLCLGDILTVSDGPDLRGIVAIRHAYKPDHPLGLRSAADVTPERVLAYTSGQERKYPMFAKCPLWLVFVADGSSRSRFYSAYDNLGEIVERRTEADLWFNLSKSDYLRSLQNRLIIEWSHPLAWFMGGVAASRLSVTEISDPQAVPFPGFDHIVLTHAELQAVVADFRYAAWRSALGSVQAVYLIADTSSGKQYVGQASGGENLLGRWTDYATNGHGGNKGLRALHGVNPEHAHHFVYSVLRVFGPSTPGEEIDAAESHFKTAMLTRQFGLNHN